MLRIRVAAAMFLAACGSSPMQPESAPVHVEAASRIRAPSVRPTGPALPLGRDGLDETREDTLLAAGLTHTWIRRGHASDDAETGPWSIHVLTVDPERLEGRVRVALAHGRVTDRGTLSTIAATADTIAAVNAGYFVMEEGDGTPGDPAGILVIDGALVSENVEPRTSLVLHADGRARVAELRTEVRVTTPSGETRVIDGLNRAPGLVRNCGGTGHDSPTEEARHDVSCTDESELILFRSIYGEATPRGAGREVVLDAQSRVVRAQPRRGGPIPEGATVLAGTGDAADFLRRHARRGDSLALSLRVVDSSDQPLPEDASAVNGGPLLVRGGAPAIRALEEGFDYDDHLERFGNTRHPRTLAGVTREGRLLLVVADGRQPDHSLGLTFDESARVLIALGAVDGVNLDGGGSTTLVVGTSVANRPSDRDGERAIGDAILITRD